MLGLLKRKIFKWKYQAEHFEQVCKNSDDEINRLKSQIAGQMHESNTLRLIMSICEAGNYICKVSREPDTNIVIAIDQQEMKSRKYEVDFHLYCAGSDGYDSDSERLLTSVNYGRAIIRDLQTSRGEGHGSLLMRTLVEFCHKNEIRYIVEKLSPIDMNDAGDQTHKSRLLHFYSKFGFTISDIPASVWKKIVLDLDNRTTLTTMLNTDTIIMI